ncbi:Vi polysaccharide biosynthesis protein vipA/tviB [Sphingopyxis sp. LC81]|uniref:nucleotide sugar dehydrogenase n=1 Tax=Sphingopyxis sp. LC81 TaxID=1502850 RepID=UPI00050DFA27|nr:nucleotide sugar dehydrogenase [Sphingopyxis sp. LC81]KGB54077.1 Vi polysaccharide biosynthesis protein vipA/tviB [Sphingopyxis sp. LC81]
MQNIKIGVVGLGYVGLPVAVAFARIFDVVGFDIDRNRVDSLRGGTDWTGEISGEELQRSSIAITAEPSALENCNFFVVSVPTPVDDQRRPDFSMLESASRLVGSVMRTGSIVVFESTVYPGATEEICLPALEAASGMVAGRDFKVGYSPERINPGDREHPLEQVVKVVAGQDAESLDVIAEVYGRIIDAGVHRAESIKVAEAAKVLENTQRDINIALMNEMSQICDRVGIRTHDVLRAAGTKWNFLPFTPGLVGGHCIGVDPYYLTSKAEQLGYHPQMILAGRRINDGMAAYTASRVVQKLSMQDGSAPYRRVGILGITFKENVPDIRNSKVADLYIELQGYGLEPAVSDPMADPAQTRHEYGITLTDHREWKDLSALIVAVPHKAFSDIAPFADAALRENGLLCDLRSAIDPASLRDDIRYWSL